MTTNRTQDAVCQDLSQPAPQFSSAVSAETPEVATCVQERVLDDVGGTRAHRQPSRHLLLCQLLESGAVDAQKWAQVALVWCDRVCQVRLRRMSRVMRSRVIHNDSL